MMMDIWVACGIDYLFGDPRWFPHPVRLMGKYIAGFEQQVQRRRFGPAGLLIKALREILT